MQAARRDAAETLAYVDLVVEVLDARIPFSSCNPAIEALRRHRNKPALKLLNKADLADPARTQAWMDYFRDVQGATPLAISALSAGEVGRIVPACLAAVPARGSREKPLRLMLMGVPNAGKSTLLNMLARRRVAKAGDEPAVTRHEQRAELDERVSVVDMPGLLWQRLEPATSQNLAACHCIGRTAYIAEDVAASLGDYLLADYRALLVARYGELPPGTDGAALLEVVARKRGRLGRGGVPDLEQGALALLADFREGTLGRITLETPAQIAARPPPEPARAKKKKKDRD
jgi:ribosome biogenesis GTPase A